MEGKNIIDMLFAALMLSVLSSLPPGTVGPRITAADLYKE
jgi:hypothetical protein